MKRAILLAAAALALPALADRTLNRDAAARLFAPIGTVSRVETLEREGVTYGALLPSSVAVAGETTCVTAKPFATTTIRSGVLRGEDDDMATEVFAARSRNYDIFLPDDAKTRSLLPIALRAGIAGAEIYQSTNVIASLPAFVRVREPSPGVVVITTEAVR